MTVPSRTIASSLGFGRVQPPRRVQALLLARGKTRLPRSDNHATGLTEGDQPAKNALLAIVLGLIGCGR